MRKHFFSNEEIQAVPTMTVPETCKFTNIIIPLAESYIPEEQIKVRGGEHRETKSCRPTYEWISSDLPIAVLKVG